MIQDDLGGRILNKRIGGEFALHLVAFRLHFGHLAIEPITLGRRIDNALQREEEHADFRRTGGRVCRSLRSTDWIDSAFSSTPTTVEFRVHPILPGLQAASAGVCSTEGCR